MGAGPTAREVIREAKSVCEAIVGLRESRGLEQQQLAAMFTEAGWRTSHSMVGHMEHGRRVVGGRYARAYKELFELDDLEAADLQKLIDAQYPPQSDDQTEPA